MKTKSKTLFSLALATIFILTVAMSPITLTKNRAYDPTGTWTYEIETPDGAISGEMEITKDGDTYKVVIGTDDFGDLELEDVEFNDKNEMTGYVDVQGVSAEFDVEFEEDSMEGVINYGGEELPISAERDNK